MQISKVIQCTTEPFEALLREGGGVDFRLDEAAWEDLKIGNIIEYFEDFSGWDTEPAPHARKLRVRIIDIVKARTFAELIDVLPERLCRRESKDEILTDLRGWWTPEKEREIGVLGFLVEVVG